MNKKISTGAGIAVIAIAAVICALGIWKASKRLNQLQDVQLPQQVSNQNTKKLTGGITFIPTYKPSKSETAGWKTYKDARTGLEFKYPEEMDFANALFPERAVMIRQTSQDELRNMTTENTKNDQCGPGMCPDDEFIRDNFDILSRAGTCPYSDSFINEVKKSYHLFSGSIDQISMVDGIMSDSLKTCILKTAGVDGFDVDLNNVYYRAAFFHNGKAYNISFEIFPLGVFPETDAYLAQKGIYIKSPKGYYSGGDGDVTDMWQNFLSDPMAQKNIKIYDEIISTLKFTR